MTMNTTAATPGWHPDPSNPGGALRWWDGSAWTTHTHPAAPNAPQSFATPALVPQPYAYAPTAANMTFAKRNRHSLTAIAVVAAYVLLAVTTHFVLIGIVPIMLSVRAIKAKETLAPAAVIAAVIAVVVALAALH
ncbi:MAG TPA: DUF2510 domain-containing protein [Acidothermaceae bacterium]